MAERDLEAELADAYQRIEDLERSAASARELARVAMTHNGVRAIRVELTSTNAGLSLIVCDPAGDETATARRIVAMLDKSLWALIGLDENGPTRKLGSSS